MNVGVKWSMRYVCSVCPDVGCGGRGGCVEVSVREALRDVPPQFRFFLRAGLVVPFRRPNGRYVLISKRRLEGGWRGLRAVASLDDLGVVYGG